MVKVSIRQMTDYIPISGLDCNSDFSKMDRVKRPTRYRPNQCMRP